MSETTATTFLRELPPGTVIVTMEGEKPWTFEPGWDHLTWRTLANGEPLARWELPASPDHRWMLMYRPHAALLMLANPDAPAMEMRWDSEQQGWSDPALFVFKQIPEEIAHG